MSVEFDASNAFCARDDEVVHWSNGALMMSISIGDYLMKQCARYR